MVEKSKCHGNLGTKISYLRKWANDRCLDYQEANENEGDSYSIGVLHINGKANMEKAKNKIF